jgi:alpha-D-xyloside xylohydrolase
MMDKGAEYPMELIRYKQLPKGLLLETTKGQIKLELRTASIVHIVYTLEEEFSTKESLAVIADFTGEVPDWELIEDKEKLELRTSELRLEISRHTCAFTYKDKQGKLLTKEPERGGKTLVPTEISRNIYDKTSEIQTSMSVDGIRVQSKDIKEVITRKAYHTKLEFVWEDGEALYGLGSHEEGVMNLRGTSQYLYQQNMKAVVPFLLSSNGYGILMDSYGLMTFRDDVHGSSIWTDADDELEYYFVYGPEADQVVNGFRTLTGTAPMLPRWAFGYAQSKERYKTAEELLAIVSEYRERQIPLDLIILDWVSWSGELWGQKSFDPERFPDPAAMISELHELNAKFMISIWPIMTNNGPNQVEMKQHDALLGNQATYDAFNPEARALYWKQANEGLFSHGIDGWWCDCTEPFEADWTGEVKPEPEERLLINTGQSKKYLDPEYINAYSLMHSKGIYEGQRQVTEEKRVVNLTRSAFAGQQRYSAITWSGDTAAQWDTLRKQIPAGLNFVAAGVPYWTSDIGAFFVSRKEQWFWAGDYNEGCEDPGYRELYVRWLQYGTFLPMFRSHGTDTPREVWRFGEPGSVHYDTLVKFIRLRYRLLPYIYSIAGWVTHNHYTMMRPLVFDFRQDSAVFNIDDQYMFGPALLVNPITEEGANKRNVYLPVGSEWFDFWTGAQIEGGSTIEAQADLTSMPLYVRSGSILPIGPQVQYSAEKLDAAWKLLVYPGADGSFALYEDEGDNYRHETGEFASINIQWDNKNNKLTIETREGSFRNMNSSRVFEIHLMSESYGFNRLDEAVCKHIVTYEGNEVSLTL